MATAKAKAGAQAQAPMGPVGEEDVWYSDRKGDQNRRKMVEIDRFEKSSGGWEEGRMQTGKSSEGETVRDNMRSSRKDTGTSYSMIWNSYNASLTLPFPHATSEGYRQAAAASQRSG